MYINNHTTRRQRIEKKSLWQESEVGRVCANHTTGGRVPQIS